MPRKVALFNTVVASPKGRHQFIVEVIETLDRDSRMLPESFYQMGNPPTIPEGTHHEMHLTVSPAYGRVNPDVPIHVYKLEGTDQHYVCWTMPLATIRQAREVFDFWCLGTVYSLEHERDFALLLEEHPDDMPEFLKSAHRIELDH